MATQLDPIGSQDGAAAIQRISKEAASNSIAMMQQSAAFTELLQKAGMEAATRNAAGAMAQQQTLAITDLAKKGAKDVSEAFKA